MSGPGRHPTDHYDVVVIGSGPGGATTAAELAATHKRVLVPERGDVKSSTSGALRGRP